MNIIFYVTLFIWHLTTNYRFVVKGSLEVIEVWTRNELILTRILKNKCIDLKCAVWT